MMTEGANLKNSDSPTPSSEKLMISIPEAQRGRCLMKQMSQKGNCLCSPTTHPGSFRCRMHRSTSHIGSTSFGSGLSELADKTTNFANSEQEWTYIRCFSWNLISCKKRIDLSSFCDHVFSISNLFNKIHVIIYVSVYKILFISYCERLNHHVSTYTCLISRWVYEYTTQIKIHKLIMTTK